MLAGSLYAFEFQEDRGGVSEPKRLWAWETPQSITTENAMKKPRRLFRSRRNEADVVLVSEANGRNIILGDPDLSDLQGYSKEIRSRWWKAYREEGVPNPIVVAVHKRSRLARERGLTEGSEFTFLAIDTHDAVSEGWLHPDLADTPNRPPSMGIILASGESIEAHVVSDMTESGVLDLAYFDPQFRQELLKHPVLKPYIDEPWTWLD